MKNRILAIFIAISIVISMCVQSAKALTPADPLIASAVYSFVLSAGIKLWRDGGIEGSEELIEDLQELYDEYHANHVNTSDWDLMGQGAFFENGNFIYTRDTAQTLQGFTNWLGEKIGNTPNTERVLITRLSTNEGDNFDINNTDGLYYLNHQYWNLPVKESGVSSLNVYTSQGELNRNEPSYSLSFLNAEDTVYIFYTGTVINGEQNIWVRSCSLGQFQVQQTNYKYVTINGETVQQIRSVNTANATGTRLTGTSITNDGNYFKFYKTQVGGIIFLENPNLNNITDNSFRDVCMDEMSYVILAGNVVGSGEEEDVSVIGKIKNSILDVARDVVDAGELAISIGLSDAATQDQAIDAVIGDYSGSESVAIISPVATPVPVEGVSELYPQPATTDVQNLGLPALGQALTSRFPFCIPFDVVDTYKSLNATAVCPVINVDLFPQSFKNKVGVSGSTSFTLDFGDEKYALLIQLIHWGSLVGFVLMLAFATKRLIWTTGG